MDGCHSCCRGGVAPPAGYSESFVPGRASQRRPYNRYMQRQFVLIRFLFSYSLSGFRCQISRLYSSMVRSEVNRLEQAVFITAFFSHRSRLS